MGRERDEFKFQLVLLGTRRVLKLAYLNAYWLFNYFGKRQRGKGDVSYLDSASNVQKAILAPLTSV